MVSHLDALNHSDLHRFNAVLSDARALGGVEALESVLDEIYRHIAIEEYDLFPEVARNLSSQSVGSRT